MGRRWDGSGRFILAVLCVAMFMANLDISIVNISLPSIANEFNVDVGQASWVVMVYVIVLGSFLMVFGRMGDVFGFRRMFMAGIGTFTVGSLLCGLSTDIWSLVASRALEAVGAGLMSALNYAMAYRYLPEERRGVNLGILATVAGLAVAAGPVLGGYLTEFAGWRSIFLVNVPIGVAALTMAYVSMPHREEGTTERRLDLIGALLALIALTSLIFALNMGKEAGWGSVRIIGSLLLSGVSALLLGVHELRAEDPLFDPHIVGNRDLISANGASFLVMASFGGAFVLAPFYFESVKGLSTDHVGLILLAPALAIISAIPVFGWISDRYGSRTLCVAGCATMVIAFLLGSAFGIDTSILYIVMAVMAIGLGAGLFIPPNSRLVFAHTPPGVEGLSSGLMQTSKNVGMALGIVLMETVYSEFVNVSQSSPDWVPQAVQGIHYAFLTGAVLCLMALSLSLRAHDPSTVDNVGPSESRSDTDP